jgi:hypothetical protein
VNQNGEITDPPVSKTRVSQRKPQYATNRAQDVMAVKAPTPAQEIFCDKCLKNQHLFTASLAQYLPDDPDHPDYPALERNYYKFRAGLEKRYPQVCAECEPNVMARVEEAGYTAKTDFLRRTMERSRLNRATPKRRTFLDFANSMGSWLSWSGLMLQIFWHFSVVDLISRNDIPIGEGHGWKALLLKAIPLASGLAAFADDLAIWSFRVTLFSAWWNPMFVQVYRGFSRHILGLKQWYSFQAILVALRCFFPRLAKMDTPGIDQIRAQLAIHIFMVVMTIYVSLFLFPSRLGTAVAYQI